MGFLGLFIVIVCKWTSFFSLIKSSWKMRARERDRAYHTINLCDERERGSILRDERRNGSRS